MQMNVVFLDSATLGKVDFGKITSAFKTTFYDITPKNLVCERIKNADIIVSNKVRIGEEELSCAPNLKLICVSATGYNNIDLDACKKRGVGVTNVKNYSTKAVVQHTFALAFGLINKIIFFNNYVKTKEYVNSPHFSCFVEEWEEICGKKWGIIGLGTIGKSVAKIAKEFGADVSYCSISGKNDDAEFKKESLNELLQTCDIISIHCPLSDLTQNLLNAEKIALLKPNALLINVARGGIIDESAIAIALNKNKIAGFASDVFEYEPIKSDNLLLNCETNKTLFTPHIAWAGKQSRQELLKQILNNIEAFIDGRTLNRIV